MSASVVPARAGMSPITGTLLSTLDSGPRASGDEPRVRGLARVTGWWSPRERG